MTVRICCEGPTCNAGHSARDREAAIVAQLPSFNDETRDEAHRHARSTVSQSLRYTPHTRSGVTTRGGVTLTLAACRACGHERVYGNVSW